MDLVLAATAAATLRIPPGPQLVLLDAAALRSAHVPPYPADLPALVCGIQSPEDARNLKALLLTAYPAEHVLHVLVNQERSELPLSRLDSLAEHQGDVWIHVPALALGASVESLAEIVAHLRAPDGCPWDREQTHETLRTHLLEEAYEVLAAIDARNTAQLSEELGDLLLQIVLHAQIAFEADGFSMSTVVKGIYDKIIRRHPHVFGNLKLSGTQAVLENWERLKEHERAGETEQKGLLDGVPQALPALAQAQEYQARAARVGFDWLQVDGVLEKISEEVAEIQRAESDEELARELGDLFFALVNYARWKHVDSESALRQASRRFVRRFGFVESGARAQGRALSDMTLDAMETLWAESKRGEA
jgi:tetrapyrrole methylase family protein/MazG family protein